MNSVFNSKFSKKDHIEFGKIQLAFDKIRTYYSSIKSKFKHNLRKKGVAVSKSNSPYLLQPIALLIFYGKLEKWSEFINVYDLLVYKNVSSTEMIRSFNTYVQVWDNNRHR